MNFWGHFGVIWGHFGFIWGAIYVIPTPACQVPKSPLFTPKRGFGGDWGAFWGHFGPIWGIWGSMDGVGMGEMGGFGGEGFFGGPLGKVMFLPKSAQIWVILGHFGPF